jgi:hypothetical protein
MYSCVEELRQKLISQYSALSYLGSSPKKHKIKAVSLEPSLVRPTITSTEIASMLQNSSRHKKVKDLDFGPVPKKQIPFKLKVHQYEAETNLDCFMKHIANKSFERYVTEKTPAFRKGAATEIRLPEYQKKIKKKFLGQGLNFYNLEKFGQVEVVSESPQFKPKNLKIIEQSIKKNIKNWCIQEKKKIDPVSQLIDHYTFKHKHK